MEADAAKVRAGRVDGLAAPVLLPLLLDLHLLAHHERRRRLLPRLVRRRAGLRRRRPRRPRLRHGRRIRHT
jgi:hypothetical protein